MMQSVDRHEAAMMLANNGFENVSDDSVQGDEWRRYGKVRRLELLNRDREEGNNIFEINPTVRIEKYFQVINRSLDQFHAMYKEKEHCDLEELYVMGNRIQRFLVEFVPEHPEYSKPRSWHLRNKSRKEVRTLEFCLEEVAVLIDERLCNEIIDNASDFDKLLLQEEGRGFHDQLPDLSFGSSSLDDWVAFGGWHKGRETAQDESLDSTLNTTGSDSGGEEPTDKSEGDEKVANTTKVIFPLNLSESAEEDNFLCTVASQKFSFELDSDACDSWAQDHSIRQQKVKHFGDTPVATCDPAEIMFRHVLKAGSARMQFDRARLERGPKEDPPGRVAEARSAIASMLESSLDEGRMSNIGRFSEVKDDGSRDLEATRRFVEPTPRPRNASADDTEAVKLEDHYLVAGERPQSELSSLKVESMYDEKLHFDKFDINTLAEDEWIDFGDTGADPALTHFSNIN